MLLGLFFLQPGFLVQQTKFARVRQAMDEKKQVIAGLLDQNGLDLDDFRMLILVDKSRKTLDLYAKKGKAATYKKIQTYALCAVSGKPGPKRKQGDGQTPEGFYHISNFNPSSNYYLSLGINYPNEADCIKSKFPDKGNAIYIHGNCVTIGCMPITDDKIKELYLLAVYARNNGQTKIPVYIVPFAMDGQNLEKQLKKYADNTELVDFWKNLSQGYQLFMQNHAELKYSINKSGDYAFK